MSERAFVCQLTLLNIDTYSNILIESSLKEVSIAANADHSYFNLQQQTRTNLTNC